MGKGHGARSGGGEQGEMSEKACFRFQDLEIWKLARDLANQLFDLADEMEGKGYRRFAEQIRSAGLSMPNNIAEGSGSFSDQEFRHFLNIARRSTFENASMVLVFESRSLVAVDRKDLLLGQLDTLSRKITSFRNTLD
jgi:four helix bundle protein